MKINLPENCVISFEGIVHKALVRPKFFFKVIIKDEKKGFQYVRFVRGIPFLLRLRLAIASRRLCLTVTKHKKFLSRLQKA